MKKNLLLLLPILVGLGSCGSKPTDPPSTLIDYEKIYQPTAKEKYPTITDYSQNKASFGYTKNSVQGHNGWYYEEADGSRRSPLLATDDIFKSSDVMLKGPLMSSKNGKCASRVYQFPEAFAGQIDGKLEPKSGTTIITLKISLGTNLLKSYHCDLNSKKGISISMPLTASKGERLYFDFEGEGEILFNPTLSYATTERVDLHPKLLGKEANGNQRYFGDVHPYYANNKLYMYYLKTNGNYDSALSVSSDMFNYSDELNYRKDPVNGPSAPYYTLGITKVGDEYFSMSGYSNEVIWGSKSKDLLNWEKADAVDDDFNSTYLPKVDGVYVGARDPYAFYDPDIDAYRIIYLSYYNNKYWEGNNPDDFDCALTLTTSTDNTMKYFKKEQRELLRFDNAGASKRDEVEVPQMMKIGDRWYIFGSIYGRTSNGVGGMSYWMGEKGKGIDETEFIRGEELTIDGEDLCAAQMVDIGGRIYMYGWIPSNSNSAWGGSLNLPREIFQRADGTLGSRLDPFQTELLKAGTILDLQSAELKKDVIDKRLTVTSDSEFKFPQTFNETLIEGNLKLEPSQVMTLKLQNPGSSFYTSLQIDNKNKLLKVISKTAAGEQIKAQCSFAELKTQNEFTFKAVIEKDIVEFFLNDEISLTAKVNSVPTYLKNYEMSLKANNGSISFNEFNISALASPTNIYDLY